MSRGKDGARHGAARPVLVNPTAGQQRCPTLPVIPVEAGPKHSARVSREIRPAVVVYVPMLLKISAPQKRCAPMRCELWCQEHGGVCFAQRGAVEEKPVNWLPGRSPRDEIDDTSHGCAAIKRRGIPFDDFDLSKVHSWNLQ